SRSPQLQVAGLKLAGLEGNATRVELGLGDADQLRDVLTSRFDALSVTSPLKYAAFECCDELSDVAARTQSVNSMLVRDGKILGASTDGEGFIEALRHEFGSVVGNAHAVILGSGGAASAILDALVDHGVASVVVHGRNEEKIEELTRRYKNVYSSSLVYRPIDLIVNTLPIGGRGNEASVLQGVHHESVAVDITYDPVVSEWRKLYDEVGCRTMNGLAMLAFQAALQMQWWWDVPIEGAKLLEVLHD
ncbi:MAG TPA: NAD(P)-binding domain-containing protein, partial [Acidimicrobiales bacterium]